MTILLAGIDQFGLLIDFRLTARRDARAARAFLKQAIESAGLYYPDSITTDKAWNYQKVIRPMRGFKSLKCAKATLKGIESIRTIRKGGVYDGPVGPKEEQGYINTLFGVTD